MRPLEQFERYSMIVKEWIDLLKKEFRGYNSGFFIKDLLAGLTVAAVALPLALAFGVASNADAAAGLVTAVLAGVVIGIFSGAPYQISGPTGAMSAVLIVLVNRYGMQGIWIAGILAGIILILMGIFRLGKLISLIPAPVITGFTSGIAIIIFLGQVDNALGIKTPAAESILSKLEYYLSHSFQPNWFAFGLVVLVIAIMIIWPKLKIGSIIPGSLVAIFTATLVAQLTGLDIPTIGSIPRTILLENRFSLTQLDWTLVSQLIIPAMSIAALGAIESLLCGAVAGNMTGIRMHNSVELVAQGIGNIIIPFFGGIPATAAIARVSVNVKSGGKTRLSSIIHGLVLMVIALTLAPLIGKVPMAALAGVLMMTAWRMNEWASIHFIFNTKLKHAMIAFGITLLATVFLDLSQAILIGFGLSSLIFITQISDLHIVRQPADISRLQENGHQIDLLPHQISVYYLSGPLFFAAARKLLEEVEQQDDTGSTLILSMRGVPLVDSTGIKVLREIWQRQVKGGGNVLLSAVQPRVLTLMERAGFVEEIGANRFFWSSDRAILSLGASLQPISYDLQKEKHDFDSVMSLPTHPDMSEG
jgi:sulfate permease, SulP family